MLLLLLFLHSISLVVLFYLFVRLIVFVFSGKCTSKACLMGKMAIVTGGNQGMGYHIALNLATRGCRVVIADVADATESVKSIIKITGNPNIYYQHLDLGSIKSVRKFADDFLQTECRLDLLMNNAGIAGCDSELTADGLLRIMQINYFGHVLLTCKLSKLLKQTPGSRIVFTSSLLAYMNTVRSAEDLNRPPNFSEKILHYTFAYGNSKVAMLVANKVIGNKLAAHDVTSVAVHPAVTRTNIFNPVYNSLGKESIFGVVKEMALMACVMFVGRHVENSAQVILDAALNEKYRQKTGLFLSDGLRLPETRGLRDEQFCNDVWAETERLLQLTDDEKI